MINLDAVVMGHVSTRSGLPRTPLLPPPLAGNTWQQMIFSAAPQKSTSGGKQRAEGAVNQTHPPSLAHWLARSKRIGGSLHLHGREPESEREREREENLICIHKGPPRPLLSLAPPVGKLGKHMERGRERERDVFLFFLSLFREIFPAAVEVDPGGQLQALVG